MPTPTTPATTATTTTNDRSDSPATALGPTSLVLGVIAAVGSWVPQLVLFALPWTIIAGGLAVVLGAAGIHQARLGIGRMWTAATGTVLGTAGFVGTAVLLAALSA